MEFENTTLKDLLKILCSPEIAKKLIKAPTKEDDLKQNRKNDPQCEKRIYSHYYYVTRKMNNYEKGIIKRFQLLDRTRQLNIFIQLQSFLIQ